MAFSLLSAAPAEAGVYVTESFSGTVNPSGWTFTKGASATGYPNYGASMSGDGWLRLTQNSLWQSSFVYYNTPIPTNLGLTFEFDFVIWNTASSVADGFTLALFDAAVTPAAGGYGGSLGYAQRSGIDGLAGAVAGFGFDEFGNYSNPTEGRVGGPGLRPNSIAIRGSMGATRQAGYAYQTGTGSLANFSTKSAATRLNATIHTVRITIPTSKQITIEWKKPNDLVWETLINGWPCTLTCPEYIKFGFTAGTGGSSAYHEVRNLEVRDAAVPEPGSFALALGLGIAAVVGWRRRRRTA